MIQVALDTHVSDVDAVVLVAGDDVLVVDAPTPRRAMDGEVLPAAAELAILPEPQFLRSRDRAALLAALDAGTFPAGGVEMGPSDRAHLD